MEVIPMHAQFYLIFGEQNKDEQNKSYICHYNSNGELVKDDEKIVVDKDSFSDISCEKEVDFAIEERLGQIAQLLLRRRAIKDAEDKKFKAEYDAERNKAYQSWLKERNFTEL